MRQKIVGTYEFGYEKAELVLREGDGGEFYLLPGDIDCPRIKVGADQPDWRALIAVLLHEAFEFACARVGLRYSPSDDLGRDHAAYVFVMDHPRFTKTCALVADFAAQCLPDLEKAWKKWKAKK